MKTNSLAAYCGIELLESRIAPASAFVTYTDIDGDLVKITATKPGAGAPPLDLADLAFAGGGLSLVLDLTEPGFEGAKIVFSVTKKTGGDGLAHVGYINATERSLDQVIVKGDLGKIIAGDAATSDDTDLNLLSVRSLGALGLVTGAPDLVSVVYGKLGALKVAGDVTDARLGANGSIGSIFIGGNLTGNSAFDGRITSAGGIGSVRIVGSLVGGDGDDTGQIVCNGSIASVQIGGDLLGGAGARSGRIDSGASIGPVKIAGDLAGGAGAESARLRSAGTLGVVSIGGDMIGGAGNPSGTISSGGEAASITIRGSLLGGSGGNSGQIFAKGLKVLTIGGSLVGGGGGDSAEIDCFGFLGTVKIGGSIVGGPANYSGNINGSEGIGSIKIGGDLRGGSITGVASAIASGLVWSENGSIGSVTIGGSLIAGTDASIGSLTRSGAIVAQDDLGPVKIGGSIVGNSTNSAFIFARGQEVKPTSGFDVTIASLAVKGDVVFARIFAGFTPMLGNADASIGAVTVGGDWVASSLVAGAQDTGADGFGVNDALQTVNDTALIARIASVAIKGSVTGSLAPGDNFGFVAQQIDKLKIGARTFTLTPGPSNAADNVLIPFTDDMHLLEV